MLGHDGPPTGPAWKENLVDGEATRALSGPDSPARRPEQLVAEIHRHVNEYYPFYEDGHLLSAGGISDQPARYIAYMLEIGD
jgi:hypothetical protein